MNRALEKKIEATVQSLRRLWPQLKGKHRFVAFSTGKDSLALAAMLYEAVAPERPTCLYAHHNMEFASNLDYLEELRQYGFAVEVVEPFLGYFDLTERGIGFLTLKDPWCVPMLVGTGILEWLQRRGARTPREAVMFRGMSGSEYSHKYHSRLEIYNRLDLPCVNAVLDFTKEEILEVIRSRYGIPLNPIYEHMDRTYCICCYTSDARRQAYSAEHHPEVCKAYYAHVDALLFGSGLIDKAHLASKYTTREEKIDRHGFVHWRRTKLQNIAGAVKRRLPAGVLAYSIREANWISPKHLKPVAGRWSRAGNELRLWNVPEKQADTLIKRMMNCLDCGFCVVACLPCRRFNRDTKTLQIDSCIQCGKCIRLRFCMGWRHRFWRRVIVEG